MLDCQADRRVSVKEISRVSRQYASTDNDPWKKDLTAQSQSSFYALSSNRLTPVGDSNDRSERESMARDGSLCGCILPRGLCVLGLGGGF